MDYFKKRMQQTIQKDEKSNYKEIPWKLHKRSNFGDAQETHRNCESVQKDWAFLHSYEIPEVFCIAVRAHKGWNHLDGAGTARYCLAVSFEAVDIKLPIYTWIESEIKVESKIVAESQILV